MSLLFLLPRGIVSGPCKPRHARPGHTTSLEQKIQNAARETTAPQHSWNEPKHPIDLGCTGRPNLTLQETVSFPRLANVLVSPCPGA
eukprot:8677711-Pyramimonas_sp.AAC.1